VDPLLSLTSLPANIEHAIMLSVEKLILRDHFDGLYTQLAHRETCLVNACGFGSGTQYICFIRYVVWSCQPFYFVEEAVTALARSGIPLNMKTYYGAESIR
jgi:hypothetical protein